ncbi:unnamed protein product [Closterium sp. Yama58-4]|nr:unnamed protein product [Closterium sp. Yama58-4]
MYNEVLHTVPFSYCTSEESAGSTSESEESSSSGENTADEDWVASGSDAGNESDVPPVPNSNANPPGTQGTLVKPAAPAKRVRRTKKPPKEKIAREHRPVVRQVRACGERENKMPGQGGSIYRRRHEVEEKLQPAKAETQQVASGAQGHYQQPNVRSGGVEAVAKPGDASHHAPASPQAGPSRTQAVLDAGSPDHGRRRSAASELNPSALVTPQRKEVSIIARGQSMCKPTGQYCSPRRQQMLSPASVRVAEAPRSPLVNHSPAHAGRSANLGAGLPGMVPTPFFDGGVGQAAAMDVEHGDSSPEEDTNGKDEADRDVLELHRLLRNIRARNGGDLSAVLGAVGSRGTAMLGADEMEVLGSIGSGAPQRGERGKAPVSGGHGSPHPSTSHGHRHARTASRGFQPEVPHTQPSIPAPLPSQPAPKPQAGVRGTHAAPRAQMNRGMYNNRLGKEREHLINTHGAAHGSGPPASAPRVGGSDKGQPSYRTRGAGHRDLGAGADMGNQGRGMKRERNVPQMTLIIDYDPERSGEGLIRGMPSPDEIVVHAKLAMDFLLRNCSARGVTLFPSNTVRNEALRIILRATHDVSYIQVSVAMSKTEYSSKVHKVWTKFRNDSSSFGRYKIVCGLGIDVVGRGVYKMKLDPKKKAEWWETLGPQEHEGHKVSSWSIAVGDRRPFTSALFFAACKAAYPEWVTADGILVLVPYHIAWVLFSFDYGMTNTKSKSLTLSQSPQTNDREMVEVVAEVEEAIKMWLVVAKGRLYVPELGAFKWGEAGLFINESGFQEYLPEEYRVRSAAESGDKEQWMA